MPLDPRTVRRISPENRHEKGQGVFRGVGVDWKEQPRTTPSPGRFQQILDPAFFVPYQDRLRPLYGSAPHRISHVTAMEMAPTAIKAGFVLNVSGPPVDPEEARRFRVQAYEESGDTLLVGANPWEGTTWISQPERALLECLKSDERVPIGEAIAAEVLHSSQVVSPETVVSLSQRLEWDHPLRRLASIAARMDNCRGVFRQMPDGFLADDQRALLDVPPAHPDAPWICVMPSPHPEPASDVVFRDEKYRVVWCWLHPHELLEDLLY